MEKGCDRCVYYLAPGHDCPENAGASCSRKTSDYPGGKKGKQREDVTNTKHIAYLLIRYIMKQVFDTELRLLGHRTFIFLQCDQK